MAKTTFFLAAACVAGTHAFAPAHPAQVAKSGFHVQSRYNVAPLRQSAEENQESNNEEVPIELTAEEKKAIGNLVADEEWAGLSMELADVVRTAVVEDLKKNSRDFLGKDDYAIGDFSKEVDRRVKEEVAKMREKDDYELGDLSVVLDGKVKELVCELSGKEECLNPSTSSLQFGDLSVEIDKRVKSSVAEFCGKDTYSPGDLSKEFAKRTKSGILNYTGKDSYKFGDITAKAIKNYTGKDEYQFGDVTKKLMGNLLGKKDGK
eukprot:scaffold682_cov113-Skeletonema_menzelii.AAC.3